MMIRRLFGVSLAVMALALPSPIRADDEAAALLAKHKAYVGWEFGDGTFKTMRVETTVTRIGKDGKTETVAHSVDLQRGVVNRQSFENADGTGAQVGFTGSVYWLSDGNGFTIPRLDDGRKTTLALTILFGEGTTTLPATVLRRETVDGAPLVVLREKIPNADALDLYVDPATGAYRRAVIDPDGESTQVLIDNYGEIAPGKRAVSGYHYAGEDLRRSRAVTSNVTIADEQFHPPAPRATWTFGSGQPFYIDVTEYRISVDAIVNGVRGRFILDTGAGGIFFNSPFAAKAKLHALKGGYTAYGVTGSTSERLMQADTIEFGDGSKLQNVVVASGDMHNIVDADGLMGFDFLAGAIVDVDLDSKKMTLYDPKLAALGNAGGAVVVPDLSSLTPRVPAKLNGTIPTRGFIDSGNSTPLLLNSIMRGKTRTIVDKNQLAAQRLMAGVGDRYEVEECGQLGSIDLGALHYEHVPACFAPGWSEDEALIGFDFIKNFNLVIDYPDDKIILFPRKKYQ